MRLNGEISLYSVKHLGVIGSFDGHVRIISVAWCKLETLWKFKNILTSDIKWRLTNGLSHLYYLPLEYVLWLLV